MSDHVDLNHKVWGFKAKSHIIVFFVVEIFCALLCMMAIVDYMSLPADPPKKVKGMVLDFIIFLPYTLMVMGCILCSALGCQNRIAYGVMSIILGIGALWALVYFILGLSSIALFGTGDSKYQKNLKKYYSLSIICKYFSDIGETLARIYLSAVLINLSFLYPTKPQVVVVVTPETPRKKKSSKNSGNSGTGTGGDSGDEEEE